jgi:hypothetical protein
MMPICGCAVHAGRPVSGPASAVHVPFDVLFGCGDRLHQEEAERCVRALDALDRKRVRDLFKESEEEKELRFDRSESSNTNPHIE